MIDDTRKSGGVFGKWFTGKNQRCDYCSRVVNRIMVVREGDCTGSFCSTGCFEMAKEKMDKG